MIHLVVDDVAGRRHLASLRAVLGDPSTASLNTATFDGARLEHSELMAACEAMPFLAERRLIIVRGLLARSAERGEGAPRRGARREGDDPIAEYLSQVPPTTDLVFVEAEPPPKGALLRAIEQLASRGGALVVQDAPLGDSGALDWVREQAAERGTTIAPDAAMVLVEALGRDRRDLAREIEKLALLAADRRIELADVRALVPASDDANVFQLVDALGNRNARAAIRAWRRLLHASQEPYYLLSMVGRQVRLLLIVHELAQQRQSASAIASTVGLPPRIAANLVGQSRAWTADGLRRFLDRLVAIDHASKIGGQALPEALEGLIAEMVAPAR